MNLLHKSLSTLIGGAQAEKKADALIEHHPTIPHLLQTHPDVLAYEASLTKTQSERLTAALMLLKLPLKHSEELSQFCSPEQVVSAFSFLLLLDHEQLWLILLNRQKRVLKQLLLTKGSADLTIVDPRQIFQRALLNGASAIILVHNHPSGDPTPSAQDIQISHRVEHIGRLLQIPLLDHIIIAQWGHTSLAEKKLLHKP
jgi:DNA repair protein RadC